MHHIILCNNNTLVISVERLQFLFFMFLPLFRSAFYYISVGWRCCSRRAPHSTERYRLSDYYDEFRILLMEYRVAVFFFFIFLACSPSPLIIINALWHSPNIGHQTATQPTDQPASGAAGHTGQKIKMGLLSSLVQHFVVSLSAWGGGDGGVLLSHALRTHVPVSSFSSYFLTRPNNANKMQNGNRAGESRCCNNHLVPLSISVSMRWLSIAFSRLVSCTTTRYMTGGAEW